MLPVITLGRGRIFKTLPDSCNSAVYVQEKSKHYICIPSKLQHFRSPVLKLNNYSFHLIILNYLGLYFWPLMSLESVNNVQLFSLRFDVNGFIYYFQVDEEQRGRSETNQVKKINKCDNPFHWFCWIYPRQGIKFNICRFYNCTY